MRVFGGNRPYSDLCVNCNALEHQEQMAREKKRRQDYLFSIRQGNLPIITPTSQMYLDSDALCYLYIPATYSKENDANQVRTATAKSGSLIVTNKNLCFLSSGRSSTVQWTNIMLIQPYSHGVSIRTSKGVGSGYYEVNDADIVHAVLETCVKIAKRQLLPPNNVFQSDPSRNISQHVRTAVWQIYAGKCAQCGADSQDKGVEIQYDHIIPFSRGGASTVENVQLLCSICNKKKGSKI